MNYFKGKTTVWKILTPVMFLTEFGAIILLVRLILLMNAADALTIQFFKNVILQSTLTTMLAIVTMSCHILVRMEELLVNKKEEP